MMYWTQTSRLPETEPDDANYAAYAHPQLLCGASDDGRFVYDAIWVATENCFVLTFLWINEDLGFVEYERRVYPATRAQLLIEVARFQAEPEQVFQVA